jgi:hypothetical protein
MNKGLKVFALVCATVSWAGGAPGQTGPTPVERERTCIHQARERGLTGASFNAYMDKCAGRGSAAPVAPPAQPPGSTRPAAPALTSPRARSCWQMTQELGLKGGAAMVYYDRCLLR